MSLDVLIVCRCIDCVCVDCVSLCRSCMGAQAVEGFSPAMWCWTLTETDWSPPMFWNPHRYTSLEYSDPWRALLAFLAENPPLQDSVGSVQIRPALEVCTVFVGRRWFQIYVVHQSFANMYHDRAACVYASTSHHGGSITVA